MICFSYAPPGGLLSMPAQQYTQEFITSVVVGKDVVPRIGLRQMESLRADLINAIKRSVDPKVITKNNSYLWVVCFIAEFFYLVEDYCVLRDVLWVWIGTNVRSKLRSWWKHC